jgi:hypothetical protein
LANVKKVLPLLALLPVLLLGAGCSGINSTGSVSPLMFLMPGLGQTKPEKAKDQKPENTASIPPTDAGKAVKTL